MWDSRKVSSIHVHTCVTGTCTSLFAVSHISHGYREAEGRTSAFTWRITWISGVKFMLWGRNLMKYFSIHVMDKRRKDIRSDDCEIFWAIHRWFLSVSKTCCAVQLQKHHIISRGEHIVVEHKSPVSFCKFGSLNGTSINWSHKHKEWVKWYP